MKKVIYLIAFVTLTVWNCSDNSSSEPFNPNPPDDDGPIVVDPLTDDELMDLTQRETFKYFWNFAQTNSKAAKERYHPNDPTFDQNTVATGGSGFGLMAILVGIERGYVTRAEAVARLQTILDFFENADRFHGAWPHWIMAQMDG